MKATDGSGLRKRQQRGFAAVPNETVFDAGLSARALGVLTKLVALPVDWDLRRDWLVRQFPEGRDAITTAVRELRRLGFYRVERRRRDDGTFTTGISVSDVALPEWVGQHAAACTAQGTARPKFDVCLRVLPDGRLEDEPIAGPPQREELPFDTVGDDPDTLTADWESVDGKPVIGSPVTGLPDVNTQTVTQTSTSGGDSEGASSVSSGLALEPPSQPAPSSPPAPPPLDPASPPVRSCRRWPSPHGSCGTCATDREILAAWEAAAHRAALDRAWATAEAERARQLEARRLSDAERAACQLCSAEGLLPSGERCRHDPAENPGPGRAAFQEALGKLPAPPTVKAAARKRTTPPVDPPGPEREAF